MGMYTEIYVNVDLKRDTPAEVILVLKAMCRKLEPEVSERVLESYPHRWHLLFNNGSYYTPFTHCQYLEYDEITKQWSLLGKGDIKNYGGEIQEFFNWIMPHVDGIEGDFIGYHRYEESQEPVLHFITRTNGT